jgi:uncharacterized protein (DUF2147 family)
MVRKVLACLAFFAAAAAGAQAATPDAVIGVWLTGDKDGHIEIARCGESVCGKIVWLKEAGATDARNRDPALRSRPLLGVTLIQGFKPTKTGWAGGQGYDPKRGMKFRAELAPQGRDALRLRGCVGPICEAQTWTRVR